MNTKYIVVVILIFLIVGVLLWTNKERFTKMKTKESFAASTPKIETYIPHEDLGFYHEENPTYDLIDPPYYEDNYNYPSYDAPYPQHSHNPVDIRYNNLADSYNIPLTSRNLDTYDVNLMDPQTYSYSINPPRVQLKDKNMDYSPSTFIRGDIPITYHPDIPLIGKSRYGRDSQNLAGLFSDHYKALYNKLTGQGYKNVPIAVAGYGAAAGYGGAAGETWVG